MPINDHLDAILSELSERGQVIYETKLKALLEPDSNNKFVAVHIDTGQYEVARSSAEAMRAMLRRRLADGRLYIRKIGNEPEYGLAARLVAGEMAARSK